jgi:hypothetical protein
MKIRPFGALASALLALSLGGAATAQEPAGVRRPMRPEDFGVGNVNVLAIPAASFVPKSSGMSWTIDLSAANAGYVHPTSGIGQFVSGFSLPEGARIDTVVLYYDDTDPTFQTDVTVYRLTGFDEATAGVEVVTIVESDTNVGKNYKFSTAVNHTVSNSVFLDGGQYILSVSCGSTNTGFRAVEVWWERQISPAPATATFADVPTNYLYFRAIEALAASGITGGCGGGNFCPAQNVTRGEMAAFLARALGLSFNNNIF